MNHPNQPYSSQNQPHQPQNPPHQQHNSQQHLQNPQQHQQNPQQHQQNPQLHPQNPQQHPQNHQQHPQNHQQHPQNQPQHPQHQPQHPQHQPQQPHNSQQHPQNPPQQPHNPQQHQQNPPQQPHNPQQHQQNPPQQPHNSQQHPQHSQQQQQNHQQQPQSQQQQPHPQNPQLHQQHSQQQQQNHQQQSQQQQQNQQLQQEQNKSQTLQKATNRIGLLQAGSILSFWAEAADLLLGSDNGDAALLYFHILRKGHGVPQGWELSRTSKAQNALEAMGLYDASVCANEPPPVHSPIPSNSPPNYSRKDVVARCKDRSNGFSDLLQRTEQQMGTTLSSHQERVLLELFEHVGLSPAIITMLIHWVIKRHEEVAGVGQRPPIDKIKKEGYRWYKLGINTVEKVDHYMIEEGKLSQWQSTVLAIFHIYSREVTESERELCELWYKWEISEGLLELAYVKTVEGIGNFKWPYCRKIIHDWHTKGFKTVKEVNQFDNNFASRPKPQKSGSAPTKNGPRIGQPSQATGTAPKNDSHSQNDMELLLRTLGAYPPDQNHNHDPNNPPH